MSGQGTLRYLISEENPIGLNFDFQDEGRGVIVILAIRSKWVMIDMINLLISPAEAIFRLQGIGDALIWTTGTGFFPPPEFAAAADFFGSAIGAAITPRRVQREAIAENHRIFPILNPDMGRKMLHPVGIFILVSTGQQLEIITLHIIPFLVRALRATRIRSRPENIPGSGRG